ncbi:MAG: hypothetical protein JWQ54_452 [Mucilaginibacter sp.]|nr:hypothetical protein [Mucilaginibacter sp.]
MFRFLSWPKFVILNAVKDLIRLINRRYADLRAVAANGLFHAFVGVLTNTVRKIIKSPAPCDSLPWEGREGFLRQAFTLVRFE